MHSTHRQDGTSMRHARHQSNWNTRRNICRSKVGLLSHTSSPHYQTPYHPHEELGGRDEPMGMNHVGGLLIEHIVQGVSGIPGYHQANLE